MKVYIVTDDYYGGDNIVGVFSTKKKADRYMKECEGNGVEEWCVNEQDGHVKRDYFRCHIRPDGSRYDETGKCSAHPTWRTPFKPTAARHASGVIASATSFISAKHAKKLAEAALQALYRKEAMDILAGDSTQKTP